MAEGFASLADVIITLAPLELDEATGASEVSRTAVTVCVVVCVVTTVDVGAGAALLDDALTAGRASTDELDGAGCARAALPARASAATSVEVLESFIFEARGEEKVGSIRMKE